MISIDNFDFMGTHIVIGAQRIGLFGVPFVGLQEAFHFPFEKK